MVKYIQVRAEDVVVGRNYYSVNDSGVEIKGKCVDKIGQTIYIQFKSVTKHDFNTINHQSFGPVVPFSAVYQKIEESKAFELPILPSTPPILNPKPVIDAIAFDTSSTVKCAKQFENGKWSILNEELMVELLNFISDRNTPYAVIYGAEKRFGTSDDRDLSSEEVVKIFLKEKGYE